MVKKERANRLLNAMSQPVINGQVIRELGYNLGRKAGYDAEEVWEVIRYLYRDCEIIADHEKLFYQATRLQIGLRISYWDSLIVAAALVARCDTLYSEDMQHGQVIAGALKIINPFLFETH
ncbi:MAG: PIN domain-containing protein [Magnetococcales bacterium]|nr:PIN domain-containing protein [Magnetococcales bacterium]